MGDMADDEFAKPPVTRFKAKTCAHCGYPDCRWGKTPAGWRLFDMLTDEIHVCEDYTSEKKDEDGDS